MEIQTTLKELPERIKDLKIDPETKIRLIINEIPPKTCCNKSHFPFLHSGVWSDEQGPTDISENVDHYLYDMDNIHGD